MVWVYSLGSVALVSLLSVIGILFLTMDNDRLQRMLLVLVSFAVGALAGDAFIHLIPEAFEQLGIGLSASLLIILGMILFFSVERFIRWRHCHITTSEVHVHPVAALNLVGDGVHNFIDGIIIGASYIVSVPIGIATTLAVIFHEIPQELGDFGILVHAGLSARRALLFNFASALGAILGVVLVLTVGSHVREFSLYMIPITAGGFIYIAGSDLIPEIQGNCGGAGITFVHLAAMLAGIGLMVALAFVG